VPAVAKQTPALPETGRYGATCHKSSGDICDGHPVTGGTICWRHLPGKKARANAIVRREFFSIVPTGEFDLGRGMLRLAQQADARATMLANLIDHGLPDDPGDIDGVVKLLIGDAYDENGNKSGEFIKGLVTLEAQERDRAFRYMAECAKAGIVERLVQLEEDKAAGLLTALRLMLTDLGVTPTDDRVVSVMRTRLMELETA
jgi:hypothetical protein